MIIKFLISVRIPVPNSGACDWGLPNADSCAYCQEYYDPRDDYGNNEDGKCVWVPNEGKCFPKKHSLDKGWTIDEECAGNFMIRQLGS